mgnify:CR=1 FL=1
MILTLYFSNFINTRDALRKQADYEIVLLPEQNQDVSALLKQDFVKTAYRGKYYDYYSNSYIENAIYINVKNPYRLDANVETIEQTYGVKAQLNQQLASYYLQGDTGNDTYIILLMFLLLSFVIAVIGVGIIRTTIQLNTMEQIKDYGILRCIGATQGQFAVESAVNELAEVLGMDPTVLREKNMVRQGDKMPAYYGEVTNSCTLDRCLARAKEMINWDEKYPYRDMGNGKVRSVGVAMSMQGSGISAVDTGAVEIKVNDDGFYSLIIGATDMGTGCDTILAQMAAECLECKPEEVVVFGVDTDISPYDCGSYASSTTYVTGQAVVKTCESLRKKICERGAEYLGCKPEDVDFDGEYVTELATGKQISRSQIGNNVMCFLIFFPIT